MKNKKHRLTTRTKVRFATVVEMIFSLLTIPVGLGFFRSIFTAALSPFEQMALLVGLFSLLALSRFFRSRRLRLAGKPKADFMMQRIYAIVFLLCAVVPFFFGIGEGVDVAVESMNKALESVNQIVEETAAPVAETAAPVVETAMPAVETAAPTVEAAALNEAPFFPWADARQVIGVLFWGVLLAGRILAIVRNRKLRNVILNILLIVLIAYSGFSVIVTCSMVDTIILIVLMALASIFGVVFSHLRMDMLQKIIKKTYASEIILGLFLLICAFSYIFPFVEENIPTFTDGMWYSFAIVTTIGFGDLTATSFIGRILSVILGIYGIIVVALITSIIVNFYGEVKKDPDPEDLPEAEKTEETESPALPEE